MGKVKDYYYEEILKEVLNQQKIEAIKQAFRDYITSEGCDCCRVEPEHTEAANELGELLGFEKFPDGSGYNWYNDPVN